MENGIDTKEEKKTWFPSLDNIAHTVTYMSVNVYI